MTQLIEMTVHLTVTALFILIFKRLFRRRLTAKQQMFIWLLLAVRLFMPGLPQSSFSVFNVMRTPRTVVSQMIRTPVEQQAIPSTQAEQDILPAQVMEQPAQMKDKTLTAEQVFFSIWLVGASGLFLFFLIPYAIFNFRTARMPKITDGDTLVRFRACKRILHIKRRVRLVSGGETPILVGMLRPVVVLPDGYSEAEQKQVFLHELCHLKNGDIFYLWLAMLVLCLNWFNPVIWYAFFVFRRDVELFCDQRVLRCGTNKKEYASLLLKTALRKNRFVFGTTALQNGEKEVSHRIKRIAYFKKPKIVWSVLALVLAAAICTACLTDSAERVPLDETEFSAYCSQPVGAIMADLDYLSEDKVVFHYLKGFFVYDRKAEKLVQSIDLSKLNCAPHQQGSNGIAVSVDEKGENAWLINYGPEEEIKDFDNYVIDLKNGIAKKTKQPAEKNKLFEGLSDTFTVLPSARGWYSTNCVKLDSKIYYLTVEEPQIGSLKLICAQEGAADEETYLFRGAEEKVVNFVPGDIHDITAAELRLGSNFYPETYQMRTFMLSNKAKLAQLETMLNTAVPLGESAKCPFEAALYLTRSDGTRGVVYPASDSCMIYRSGELFYNCGGEDNSEFYALFDVKMQASSLYLRTEQYLQEEFQRVYAPLYDIQSLEISDWRQEGNEAAFLYKMTYLHYNRDPDRLEYIQEAKKTDEKRYRTLYEDYLALKEVNYEFKITISGDEKEPWSSKGVLTLYTNVDPKGTEWKKVQVDDFVQS